MPYSLIEVFADLIEDFQRYLNGNKNPFIILMKLIHNPGMIFSIVYRFERYFYINKNIILKVIGYIFYPFYFIFTYYILSYHIEPTVEINGGLFLHNRNIVITDKVKIGHNFTIMGQTTIGTDFETSGFIIIGSNVKVGAGAKIISHSNLKIANDVTIGANAVVTKNIKLKGSTYVGVPAKLIKKNN